MTEVVDRPNAGAPSAPARFEKRRYRSRLGAEGWESLGVLLIAFTAYFALGVRLVVVQHVVVFDALSRLAHAYFVWWNAPPKLAAIGFVWPPVSTLVFLPAALIRPLATSLVALPLTTAFFAGLLLVCLNRTFALLGLSRRNRFAALAAFALNPMVAFYAINGMGEMVYLALLSAGMYTFLRWYLERRPSYLVLTAALMALATLARYEVFTWALFLAVCIGAALIRQHVSRAELEGALIAYLAPILYALGLWLLFNWLIVGDPLFWLHHQTPGGGLAFHGVPVPVARPGSALSIVGQVIRVNWQLFPLTLLVLVGLGLLVVFRRDLMALALIVLMSLNAVVTSVLIYLSRNENYLQLRYNMRAMPFALLGAGWLYLRAGGPRQRRWVWLGTLAVLVASWPVTWNAMAHFRFQYQEQVFTKALLSGKDQNTYGDANFVQAIGGYVVGVGWEQRMGAYVREHVHERNAILTDDAYTFPIMLFSGRPDVFVDHVDRGDRYWSSVLAGPFGVVRYVLVYTGPANDRINARYPRIHSGMQPGFTVVHRVGPYFLARVAPRPPA